MTLCILKCNSKINVMFQDKREGGNPSSEKNFLVFPWCISPQIPEPVPSLSPHGAPFGGVWGFLEIKITVICQVQMYCCSELEDKHAWNAAWRTKVEDAFCLYLFPCVWLAENPFIPPIGAPWLTSPLPRGGVGVLWSPFYTCICGCNLSLCRGQSLSGTGTTKTGVVSEIKLQVNA